MDQIPLLLIFLISVRNLKKYISIFQAI